VVLRLRRASAALAHNWTQQVAKHQTWPPAEKGGEKIPSEGGNEKRRDGGSFVEVVWCRVVCWCGFGGVSLITHRRGRVIGDSLDRWKLLFEQIDLHVSIIFYFETARMEGDSK